MGIDGFVSGQECIVRAARLRGALRYRLSSDGRHTLVRMSIRKGTTVSWSWGTGTAHGRVVEIHHGTVRRTLKGSEIARNGSESDPAYEIEQDDGTSVLKLRSEVERVDE